ncbi:nitrate reductase cytochrome c-type subunit [Helicobacter heilmannii]|uniref:nitrate reductase cytochrome c-type subunit n=1 Tax=Helicobacter heilmannii TaxID=35817 RepID=UPI0006A09B88|nr:nitrate reductase cytochrome c-type subunit [Helicobacter heilmannii]CRF45452.1 Nitrate reductase cytochrome c550-type subunit [Helicobacter heilmannii]CRF47530.1 Nitrate reductase cytochrome c550-type subunit [Helicobacter heilmannii]CRF49120.1 Nitrate reductase cytochrome c550-type subunit [Helicobacter heilmannii]CRF51068.1 Nitrate reductase cytochrome c550-type subunit [Helicobacter heilmannii]GMB93929.1 nitrate reductase cytochrome c-type subunit [Helicobacter heilmannii]
MKIRALLVAVVLVGGLCALEHTSHKKPKERIEEALLSDTQIGLRTAPLENEHALELQNYSYHKNPPGESQRFERAYENAPPMIPHDTTGLLPITKDNNQCLGCHMPDVAPTVGATPVPASHLYDFRLNRPTKNHSVSDARFNCTQCHAPQANAAPLVKNNFKPVFSNKKLEFRSDFMDVVDVGVKDLTKTNRVKANSK